MSKTRNDIAKRLGIFARGGEKAEMARMDDATRKHLRAWIVKWFRDVDDMVEAEQKIEKVYESDPEFYEDAGWPKAARDAGLRGFSRPGEKKTFAVPAGVLPGIDAGLNRLSKLALAEQKNGDKEMMKLYQKDIKDVKRIRAAVINGDGGRKHAAKIADMIWDLDTAARSACGTACIRWAAKESDLPITYSRPGAKAEMAQASRQMLLLIAEFSSLDKRIGRLIDRAYQLSAKSDKIAAIMPKNESNPDPAQIAKCKQEMAALREEVNAVLAQFKFSRPGNKAKMGRILQEFEVNELEDFFESYGVKNYDIIKSIGKIKVRKDQVGKALDAVKALNREIQKDGIGGSVAVDIVPFSRPGSKSTHAADGFYGDTEADAVRHMAKECAECEEVKEGEKWLMATDPAVGKKIGKLMDEGYPQKQAIAIALDMKRRGEI